MINCIKCFSEVDNIPHPNLPLSILSFKTFKSKLLFKYYIMKLCIIFSIILSNIVQSDIDLKLFNSCVDPHLYSGNTFTIFNFSGNIPVNNDLLWCNIMGKQSNRGFKHSTMSPFHCFVICSFSERVETTMLFSILRYRLVSRISVSTSDYQSLCDSV